MSAPSGDIMYWEDELDGMDAIKYNVISPVINNPYTINFLKTTLSFITYN